MNDFVSVIMPAYNAAKTIDLAIESVLHQTHTHFELLIIDDGSIDDTKNRIQQWNLKDTRVRLIENEVNSGVSVSRNHGMKQALGEWIAFLDSDDLWAHNKLELQLRALKHSNQLFSFTGSSFINEEGQEYPGLMSVRETLSYAQLLRHNSISTSSVLMHHSLIPYAHFSGDHMSEDFASWLNIVKHLKTVVGVNQPLLIYRLSSRSKSGNKFKSALMGYRAYRYHGCSSMMSLFYLSHHLLASVKKYKKILKSS